MGMGTVDTGTDLVDTGTVTELLLLPSPDPLSPGHAPCAASPEDAVRSSP
jgi:hypothetical protein